MPTPAWQGARNGLPGDANAVDKSAQINQLLGTHVCTDIYKGATIVAATTGTGAGTDDPANYWAFHADTYDYDQPFTMAGTTMGRVAIPVLPVGGGADLQVSLCTDASGSPGVVLTSARIPAEWIAEVAGVAALSTPNNTVVLNDTEPGPLALPQFNVFRFGNWTSIPWQTPAVSEGGGSTLPLCRTSGQYMITAGGTDSTGKPISAVYVTPYAGGTALGPSIPQPAMPEANQVPSFAVTNDAVVVAGGYTTPGGQTANTYTASWDVSTGTIGSWSAQAALPAAIDGMGCAVDLTTDTVYFVGGFTGSAPVSTFYWATAANGQITGWNTGPTLPVALQLPFAAVAGGYLVIGGGLPASGSMVTNTWYLRLNADGSPGGVWHNGPSLATGIGTFPIPAVDNAVVLVGGYTGTGSTFTNQCQTLPFGPSGPGAVGAATYPFGSFVNSVVAFPAGPGQWQIVIPFNGSYSTCTLYAVPRVSIPLPTVGLSNGSTYHIVVQQKGGDANNYLRFPVDADAIAGNLTALYRVKGSNAWTAYDTGYAISLAIYDLSAGGQPWHTWEDNGARITTLAYATTEDSRLLGGAESTQQADGTPLAAVWAIDYPDGVPWPPIAVTQL